MQIKHAPNDISLGDARGTFRVKYSVGYFVPHLILFAVMLLGFGIWLSSSNDWTRYVTPIVFVVFTLPFLWAIWRTVSTWRDELTVYKEGFVYKNSKGIHTCRWHEIKDLAVELDSDNRLKITSVEKRNGDNVAFAYKMRGLDLLHNLYSENEFNHLPESEKATAADIADVPRSLGELKANYGVKMGAFDLVPLAILFFLAVMGVLIYFTSKDILSIFVCSIPAVLVFVLVARSTFRDRKDELGIYENGFTYRHLGVTETCLWNEIEDFSQAKGGGLISIKKENGPWIPLANNLQGKDELRPYLRIALKFDGPEK